MRVNHFDVRQKMWKKSRDELEKSVGAKMLVQKNRSTTLAAFEGVLSDCGKTWG
jgi:hypothetical protein